MYFISHHPLLLRMLLEIVIVPITVVDTIILFPGKGYIYLMLLFLIILSAIVVGLD